MSGCLEVICAIVANSWVIYATCCLVHCIEENHILVLVPVQAGFPNNLIRRSRSTILIGFLKFLNIQFGCLQRNLKPELRHFQHDMTIDDQIIVFKLLTIQELQSIKSSPSLWTVVVTSLPWLLNGLHPEYECHNYPMALLAPDNECLDKLGNNPSKVLGEKIHRICIPISYHISLSFWKGEGAVRQPGLKRIECGC
jgi:hypothetical protein